jgi:hypothetical protein
MEGSKLGNFRQEYGDVVALMPKEDALPIYSRDAEIFFGPILLLMSNESNSLKTKALSILNIFLNIVKNTNYDMDINEQENM